MAQDAAERMRRFRQRAKESRGRTGVEVYVHNDLLSEARTKAKSKGVALREFLTERMEAGLVSEVGNPDSAWVATAFVEVLPGKAWDAVNDELGVTGTGDLVNDLVALIEDGIRHRVESRAKAEAGTKRQRKTKGV